MANIEGFTFDYYRMMLKRAIDAGYAISSFEKFDPKHKRTIILRHDVDYTLNGVPQLVEIETALGVTASYLFRVHAHEYNLFTPHVFRLIQQIRRLGHEVGLHFEAMTFGRAIKADPRTILAQEKRVIETILGEAVLTASEHRDVSHTVHGTINYHDVHDPLEAGFTNYALEPRYFREMKYLSDSNGFWREGDLLAHIGKHDRMQVLIHPDWWFEEDLLLKGPYFHGLGN